MTPPNDQRETYELGAPAVMPLAAVRLPHEQGYRTCLLGLTLQHPPVDLAARRHAALDITGGRADLAHAWAMRFLETLGLDRSGQLEIELAVPAFMGLGSDATLAMSVARALAWVHQLEGAAAGPSDLARGLGLPSLHALEYWGFAGGGLLLTETEAPAGDMPALLQRAEIAHPEKEAWALVFLLPRPGEDVPQSLEADRLSALVDTAAHLDGQDGKVLTDRLWRAVAADDIQDFGQALSQVQSANRAALHEAGQDFEESSEELEILRIIKSHGAVAAGRMLTGFGLFGLLRGSQPSRELRKALRDHVGHMGGIVMATITDNRGAHSQVRDWRGNIIPHHDGS